jgi:hypothetical protein
MLIEVQLIVSSYLLIVVGSCLLTLTYQLLTTSKTWHFRHDWLFTPFVVVVGCKYFFAGAGVPSF